ncbi:MAG: heavy metal-associated domain-containing protein [Bacteroidota bacterium]
MEILKFKTTIKCNGCLSKVEKPLNNFSEIKNWDVDLNNPDRILTVEADNDISEQIIEELEKLDFEIEKIN